MTKSDVSNNSKNVKPDERFYTPRAQASTARSTGSYGTPRSYRSASVASSLSDGEHFRTPRDNDVYQTLSSSSNRNSSRHQTFTATEMYRTDRRNLIPPYNSNNSTSVISHHTKQSIPEANYFRFDQEEGGDEESRGEDYTRQSLQWQNGHESTHHIESEPVSKQDIASIFSFCRHGRIEAVANLLHRGVDPNVRDDCHGNSILSIACQNGNKRLVKLALRNGANINLSNFRGNSPLHFCYKYGHLELGEYLITKGADKDLRNIDGQTCEDLLGNFN